MATEQAALLPLHDFLARLQDWQSKQSDAHGDDLRSSFDRVVRAHGALGARLSAEIPRLADLDIRTGSLTSPGSSPETLTRRNVPIDGANGASATLTVDGGTSDQIDQLIEAVALALTAIWTREQTVIQQREQDALDLALRGISNIGPVERVLQLIVDRVRDLVGSKYAALGIVGPFGQIEQFITSGITPELRTQLGAPPRGHGLLGLIIRDDRPLLIDDIATDARRSGFPEHHPPMHSLLGVPVRSKGRSIGNLYLTDKLSAPRFDEADMRLVERFALHAGIAIENARLHEEIGRLAIVEERQRISQDLHDSIIQSLYAISLSLEDLPDVITEDPAEGAARADRAIDSIHSTIRDIRNFIMGLEPEVLAEADLASGLQTLAAEFSANTLIDLEIDVDPRVVEIATDNSAHILAITREALSNIARHSGATRASVELTVDDARMGLVIGDNGRGFDVAAARSSRQRGLTNLHSRAEAIGGTLNLKSEPGAGTRLEVTVPVSAAQTHVNPAEGDQDPHDQPTSR
jgi:signal transduction histidine kinase